MKKFNRETLIAAITHFNYTNPNDRLNVEKAIESLNTVISVRESADNYLFEKKPNNEPILGAAQFS